MTNISTQPRRKMLGSKNMEAIFDERCVSQNPYLAGKNEWYSMYGDIIKGKHNWQVAAWLSLVVNIILVIGFIIMASQSHYIPYAVKIDKLGNSTFGGYLSKSESLNPIVVNAFVRRYISEVKSVVADPVAQKQQIKYVYAVSKGSAKNHLDEFYHTHNPFEISHDKTIEVQVNSVLQNSDHSWQVNWTEIHRSLTGQEMMSVAWESNIRVKHKAINSDDADILNINPFGLFIDHISWSFRK